MMGHSIGNNNHIWKRKFQGNWTLITTETSSEDDAELKEKGTRKKEMSGRVINLQHVTLNDMS